MSDFERPSFRDSLTGERKPRAVCEILPALLVAGATLIGGGISALASSSAANKAADASDRATDQAAQLQREALAIQQSNTATARGVGDAALMALARRFGITGQQAQAVVANPASAPQILGGDPGDGGQAQAAPASNAGQPNWQAYIDADPGIMQEYNRIKSAGRHLENDLNVHNPIEFAQWHYRTAGQAEGRQVPVYEAQTQTAQTPTDAPPAPTAPVRREGPVTTATGLPGTPAPSAADIDADGFYTAPRPTPQAAPTYTAPTLAAAPTYTAPTYRETQNAPLDVSIGSYEQSPDYGFQLDQGNRNILANAAATGAGQSGAALKRLQEYGQNLAMGDYGQWRDYATGQYNTNRNFTANRDDAANSFNVNNAQFGSAQANDQWRYRGAYDQSNALARFQADQGNYQYGTTLNQNLYNSDRDYATGRNDTNTNALLSLANIGQGATGQLNSATQSSANNTGNAYLANGNNQGNAAMASAGQTNNFLSNGVNALAYYYGNNGSGSAGSPTARSPVGYGIDL